MCAMVILGAGPSQRADTSGSRPGLQDANGSSSGGGGGGVPPERRNGVDARSMQELQEAAEWQLRRARAELRRAVEAQVRVDQGLRYRTRKSGCSVGLLGGCCRMSAAGWWPIESQVTLPDAPESSRRGSCGDVRD